MKKSFTFLSLLVVTMFAFQANADLWLIGNISPYSWVTNQGVQFTAVDENNYTLDLEVTATGNQYYSLTTMLSTSANDWSAIQPYRFGGDNLEIALGTETVLEAGTDKSPYTNFTKAGVYTFNFNVETRTIKVTFKEDVVVPTFNGTIYIDKASTGNIWAWDNDGNYFDAWPGKDIATLDTATVNGTAYYSFTYTHNAASPGLIFNDGSAQTSDLVPEDGKVYLYNGGSSVTISDPSEPATTPDLYLFGPAAQGWDPTKGNIMTYNETQETYSIAIAPEAPTSFSFTTKLAQNENDWEAIAAYRWGADTDGNDFVFNENYLDSTLTLIQTDQPGHAFAVPAGQYTLTVDLNNKTLVISGTITPVEPEDTTKVYILGNVVGNWDPTVGQEMTTTDNITYTATLNAIDNGDGNAYFTFTKKLGTWEEIAPYRFGAVSENDYWVTAENIGDTIKLVYGGHTIRIPAGEYTLTLNVQEMTLLIGGEIVVPVDTAQVFIIGNVAGEWDPTVGQEMATEDGVIYTAELNAVDAGDGHAYFSFTKKLGTWDEIAGYRFGAESDGNYWVTNDNDTISLVNNGESIRVDVSKYNLTLNLSEMKLVINKTETGITGDVNGDGDINVIDITTLIDIIMNDGTDPRADVNGDGDINVIDITALIDIIMNS